GQAADLALDRHPVDIAGETGHRVDLDPRPLRADAGQRQRGQYVDVGGERAASLGGWALEDQGFLGDRVEVDPLLLDVGRASQAAWRLARLHGDRRHFADPRAL